jgi:hypothetical protein
MTRVRRSIICSKTEAAFSRQLSAISCQVKQSFLRLILGILIQPVILSGAGTSRSEVSAESKDPYVLLAHRDGAIYDGTFPQQR